MKTCKSFLILAGMALAVGQMSAMETIKEDRKALRTIVNFALRVNISWNKIGYAEQVYLETIWGEEDAMEKYEEIRCRLHPTQPNPKALDTKQTDYQPLTFKEQPVPVSSSE